MAVYNREDLVQRVLARLGEVGFGQTAEPEARARVSDALDGILDEMELDRVYDFASSSEIPGAAMDPLSAIVASRLADDFALSSEEATLLAARAQGAEMRLRRYRALSSSRTYTRGHYF
ncbi:hypothetical protein Q8W71_09995 [Methylobacterium sp. NEAU 140]|uniref:hypothetical protein n=1 Tax=Methylobacterium sp. NEAU 140 TaxID=3064945 RepID=UPI0027355184|nr:hypothetical protein [Methylobacterium sp. NEAU 140]MDP4022954.1 hypothetical protein [Methylobacterium sp. NEAU 140]